MNDQARTNKRPGPCTECGVTVQPGEGCLWWEPGPDDGGDVVGRTPAGWRVTHTDKAVCEQNNREAIERDRQRRIDATERENADQEALNNQQREIDRLLAEIPNCVCTGYDWDPVVISGSEGTRVSLVDLQVDSNPALAGLSLGSSSWTRHVAYDGSTCYTHRFGNACVLYATRSVVERAWSEFPDSVESCQEWLSKYGPEAPNRVEARRKLAAGEKVLSWESKPCAGWECRAYRAGRIDLLVSEGVIRATAVE